MIILAAGQGTRLSPLTDHRPKGMVEVVGKPLIAWQIEAAFRLSLREISIVTGYLAEQFKSLPGKRYHNPDYGTTNMVETLWCAQAEFQGELIISYGDILYQDSVLQAMIQSPAPISVAIDLDWQPYWEERFSEPLDDAETLRIDHNWRILEIGQRPTTLEEIQGQYIGLMKFSEQGIRVLERTYQELKTVGVVGKSKREFTKMYMTDLLQAVIDRNYPVTAVPVRRGWLEIDSVADYQLANQHTHSSPNGLTISI